MKTINHKKFKEFLDTIFSNPNLTHSEYLALLSEAYQALAFYELDPRIKGYTCHTHNKFFNFTDDNLIEEDL